MQKEKRVEFPLPFYLWEVILLYHKKIMICLHYPRTTSKPQKGSPILTLLLAPLLIECLHIGLRERRQYQLEFMVIPLWVSMIDFFTSSRPNKSFNRFQNKIISKVDLWHCTFIIIFPNTLFLLLCILLLRTLYYTLTLLRKLSIKYRPLLISFIWASGVATTYTSNTKLALLISLVYG